MSLWVWTYELRWFWVPSIMQSCKQELEAFSKPTQLFHRCRNLWLLGCWSHVKESLMSHLEFWLFLVYARFEDLDLRAPTSQETDFKPKPKRGRGRYARLRAQTQSSEGNLLWEIQDYSMLGSYNQCHDPKFTSSDSRWTLQILDMEFYEC